ncbi:MAG: branched-chain amino acid ABC transporter permease, partial [Deltaproteobacteria bacterium]|nr:branched-chain amino acid ABC transporter permease [Deltaproteobacteria bacterium]
MFDWTILLSSLIHGLTTGALYALVALGLTLIYGVLHIINFAHGSLLMLALYGVYFFHGWGVDPYLSLFLMAPAMFGLGYALQRWIIGRASHGKDENILLVTLGLSIVIENLALYFFRSDTRTIDTAYTFKTLELGFILIPVPKVVALFGALAAALLLWLFISRTDTGRAIRAVSKERQGALLVGIDVEHIYALSFGIGLACLGVAASLLLPAYY